MKRMFGGWVAIAAAAAAVLLGVRAARTLPIGDPAGADPGGYVRGVPGPVTAFLSGSRTGAAFAGTARGVYRSGDGGRTWARIFRAGIGGGPVRALASDSEGRVLYVVAGGGLYRSTGNPFRWSRILGGRHEVLCAAVSPQDPSLLLAGTAHGVRVSADGGSQWEGPVKGDPQGPVLQVLFDPARQGGCYLLSERGLFRSQDGAMTWDRLRPGSPAAEPDEAEATEGPERRGPGFQRMAADGRGNLYLGTDHGILTSADAGRTWSALPTGGIGASPARHLLPDPAQGRILYAVTSAGLFAYSRDWRAWRPIREGLEAPGVDSLGLDADARRLWVGTRRGLFCLPVPGDVPALPAAEGGLPISEGPPVRAVQAAAIRYAEVHPGKISRWRALARWRSLFPRLTLGLDRDRDETVVSSTTQGVTRFTVGPERRALSLDFGFTWDLADLVWNPEQTSIDARSRLMVQLRQEILEEVTRLYFERRRLASEFAAHPSEDPLLGSERTLRVEELTAQLDALTGGWFSEND